MAEKFIMLELEDQRTKEIADVISNATSKKILNFLSEKEEASEGDIANALSLPINSVEYNLKKLENCSLIEVKNVLWSVKGRKVKMYKLSKKMIVIGTKGVKLTNKFKGLAATLLISAIATLGVRYYYSMSRTAYLAADSGAKVLSTAESLGASQVSNASVLTGALAGNVAFWFLAGSIFALIIYFIINWRTR
ncbi:helix-turn-helix domain-containing protein [Candidatus Pacearchaeota archaeon]|nr:helix-turn-helix domain-containing protein [Candidatus Pacearchaeota archaeon]